VNVVLINVIGLADVIGKTFVEIKSSEAFIYYLDLQIESYLFTLYIYIYAQNNYCVKFFFSINEAVKVDLS